jgi:succinate dehydrogenase / fumarate reductase cytochrome b subunit
MFPTWYRFQITSVLSILHRLTGIALAVGSILLAWWLVAIAAGGDVFAATHAFLVSPIGLLLLFGWSSLASSARKSSTVWSIRQRW